MEFLRSFLTSFREKTGDGVISMEFLRSFLTSFREKTGDGVAKCRLFSQGKRSHVTGS